MALKIIRIPRAPKGAFDSDRPASTLIKSQIAHVAEAEQQLPRNKRTNIAPESITTEHEAAEYVGKVMKRLHPKARKRWRLPPGTRAPKSGVWLGPAKATQARRARRAVRRTQRAQRAGKKR